MAKDLVKVGAIYARSFEQIDRQSDEEIPKQEGRNGQAEYDVHYNDSWQGSKQSYRREDSDYWINKDLKGDECSD